MLLFEVCLMIECKIDVESLTKVQLQSSCFDIVAEMNSNSITSYAELINS